MDITHIKRLDNNTDTATKQMLKNVVKRKVKFDKYKQKHLWTMSLTLILAASFIIYLYVTIARPFSYSFSAMFTAFVSNIVNLYFLIIVACGYGLMNLFKEKMDKAEKEFHALRCEIIDKSKDLWNDEESWKNRHLVYEMMQEQYDINLYHENK